MAGLTTFKKISRRTGFNLVGGLLVANMIAYLVTGAYVERQLSSYITKNDRESSLIETGWQVMHWSYSLLEYFKRSNPVEN